MKKVLIGILALIMVLGLVGCGPKTIVNITEEGRLRSEVDEYTIVNVAFYGEKESPIGETNCCSITISHYKDAPYSVSGKALDQDATEKVNIPCTYTDNTFTLNGNDIYSYSVEKNGDREYVVFS